MSDIDKCWAETKYWQQIPMTIVIFSIIICKGQTLRAKILPQDWVALMSKPIALIEN